MSGTMEKPYHEMTPSERLADRINRNRAIDARVAENSKPAGPARSPRKVKAYSPGKEDVTFTHAETFPLIAHVVRKLCSAKNDFVGHREIVDAMLSDPEIVHSLDLIIARNPEAHPRDWWAHSMMKWFSQAFTEGTNDYCQVFEREADTRPYRYKIRQK
jgi:hypothetical protein